MKPFAVIGTGSYGIALGRRLIQAGYEVYYGSRNPNLSYVSDCMKDLDQSKFKVVSIAKAWEESALVFLAVSVDSYKNIINEIRDAKDRESSKIVVDLSNRSIDQLRNKDKIISNAEYLENLFQEAGFSNEINIVKGFNMVSAYLMASNRFDQKSNLMDSYNAMVPICGNNENAKQKVQLVASRIGFPTSDIGDLEKARTIENLNIQCFTDWYWPSWISLLFLVFNFVWVFIQYFVFPKKPFASLTDYIEKFSVLGHLNKVLGFTSLQLLAFVYFGSVLAALVQLKNGTKYKQFPKYLDTLLKNRKQYGLYAFLFACIHVILSLIIATPAYLGSWFKDNTLTLHGELNFLSGVFCFTLFTLVALSSINSIGHSLNWSEWNFVQTKMGIACLFVGFLHAALMYLNIFMERFEKNFDNVYLLTRVKLIATYFPFLVLVLRAMLAYFPPLKRRVENIRSGKYDSQANKSFEENQQRKRLLVEKENQ